MNKKRSTRCEDFVFMLDCTAYKISYMPGLFNCVLIPNIHLLQLDINNPNQIIAVVTRAEQTYPIDVLFNNAGYVLAGALEATSDEQLKQQFNTNVFVTIRLTKTFLPYFRARKTGTIITTTSLGN